MATASPTRSYHHGNLRSALLECAERTLRERGVRELSLRQLARKVGVSHAAPRRHFEDKQALLDALAEEGFEQLGRELRAAVEATGDFEARLVGLARAYVRFATRRAALLELMFTAKHRSDAAGLREAADRAFAPALQLIAEGQARGQVVAGDEKGVAIVAYATLQGLAAMVNGGMLEGDAADDVVAETVEQLLLGLRPR